MLLRKVGPFTATEVAVQVGHATMISPYRDSPDLAIRVVRVTRVHPDGRTKWTGSGSKRTLPNWA